MNSQLEVRRIDPVDKQKPRCVPCENKAALLYKRITGRRVNVCLQNDAKVLLTYWTPCGKIFLKLS